MSIAIEKLKDYLAELESVVCHSSLEEKANHIGKINIVKTAINQLELCNKYEINGGSLMYKLPQTPSIHHTFKVAYDNESSNPENWEEVTFNGQQITLESGDIIVRR